MAKQDKRNDKRNDKKSDGIEYDERVVHINRNASVAKGGRSFSFAATVVVGDGNGNVGIGYGKDSMVAGAIQKASKDGKKNIRKVALNGDTIPFQVEAKVGTSYVRLIPASSGTGVIASAAVRDLVEATGIKDVLTKVYGSRNPMNVAKATVKALNQLKTKEHVERLRGVKL